MRWILLAKVAAETMSTTGVIRNVDVAEHSRDTDSTADSSEVESTAAATG